MGVDLFTDNVLYNLVDNHAAMLCASLLHSEIVESLCHLGTRGSPHIADKARVLLVEFLRTLAHILPEQHCAELLNAPSLIEFSTSACRGMTNRAHKARQLPSSLAEAFSVAPRQFRVSPTGVPEHTGLSTLRAKMSTQLAQEEGAGGNTGSIHSGVSGERLHSSTKEDGSSISFNSPVPVTRAPVRLGSCRFAQWGSTSHFVDPIVSGACIREDQAPSGT